MEGPLKAIETSLPISPRPGAGPIDSFATHLVSSVHQERAFKIGIHCNLQILSFNEVFIASCDLHYISHDFSVLVVRNTIEP